MKVNTKLIIIVDNNLIKNKYNFEIGLEMRIRTACVCKQASRRQKIFVYKPENLFIPALHNVLAAIDQ